MENLAQLQRVAHGLWKVSFDFFKANVSRVRASAKAIDHDYHLHIVELHNTGPSSAFTMSSLTPFGEACGRGFGRNSRMSLRLN